MFSRLLDAKAEEFARQCAELSKWWEGMQQAQDALLVENERLNRELAEARAALERWGG